MKRISIPDRAGFRAAAVVLFAFWAGAGPVFAQDIQRPAPEAATGWTAKEAAVAEDFMVVAAHPLAVEAGYQVLREGGSAVDAAIATQLVLNLVEPQSSGIGGGAFMLHWDAGSDHLLAFDGRETAPLEATPELFLDSQGQPLAFMEAVVGGRSVGTPGTLMLLSVAHRLYGRLPWEQLFQPAIDLAEDGFEVSPRLAALIEEEQDSLQRFPATRAYFFNEDGTSLRAGTLLKNPEFAPTLRMIAEQGETVFYQGEIARDIVDTVRQAQGNPGKLGLQDLADYRVKIRDPICTGYRGYEVCGMGPPSSGALTIAQILGMLEPFDMPELGPDSVEALHLFAEASKLAYADRGLYMADADFVPMPTQGLVDPGYLAERSRRIDRSRAMPEATPGTPPWKEARLLAPDAAIEFPSTSHISVVDRDGNVVSMTTTIESGFGSRLMVRGFLLNNELTDFSFVPEEEGRPVANRVEPRKRPRSSMAPTIVFDANDQPYLAIGSPGGSRIIDYVAQAIIGVLDWDLDVQATVAMPHVVNRGGATELEENTFLASLAPELEALGHEVEIRDLNSGLHAILMRDGKLYGGADPRREGIAMGD